MGSSYSPTAGNAHSMDELISLRSRDVERRTSNRRASTPELTAAITTTAAETPTTITPPPPLAPAWVPVEEEEDDDGGLGEGDDNNISILRRRLNISSGLKPNLNLEDFSSEEEEEEDVVPEEDKECSCDDDDDEKESTSCCNLKGIAEIFARGFCKAVNTILTCIRENITRKQAFVLAGAAMAAVLKTNNVAVNTDAPGSVDDVRSGDGGTETDAAAVMGGETGVSDDDGDASSTGGVDSVVAEVGGAVLKSLAETVIDSVIGGGGVDSVATEETTPTTMV